MTDTDDTVLRPPARHVGAPATTDGRADGVDDTDDTVLRPGRQRPDPTGLTGAAPVGAGTPSSSAPALIGRVPAIRLGERVIPLTIPVVLGRRPQARRFERGLQPVLIEVPSQSGQVSATHVRIWAEGTAVVVEDQRSTNGTTVREPGRTPRRVPSGGTVVVLTGTVVDIGDGNLIEILSPRLSLPDDSATWNP